MAAHLALPVLLGALVLAGCTAAPERRDVPGGPSSPPGGDEGDDRGEGQAFPEVDAHAVDGAFQPGDIRLEQGQRLRVTNFGSVEHSVTVLRDGAFLALEDRDLAPGENVVVDLPDAAEYKMRCRYHSTGFDNAGEMVARITVA